METVEVSIRSKKFVDRGFLLGPYCPIYGTGSLLIAVVLEKYIYNPILLFFMAMIVCGIIEYLTSLIMEFVFKARWWDYSDRKFNISGRVCLMNLALFGILGLIVSYIINPFIVNLLNKMSSTALLWSSIIIGIIFLVDCIVSFIVISGFRRTTKQVNIKQRSDNTEQITKMVRELLTEKSFLHRRLLNAYPKLQAIKIKMKEIKDKIEDATNDAKDAVTEKTEELRGKIEDATNDAKDAINERLQKSTRNTKLKLYLQKKYLGKNYKGKIEDRKRGLK